MATQASTAVLGLKVVKRQLDKAIKTFDERAKEIRSQKSILESRINKYMNSLIQIVEDRKKHLLKQLDVLTDHKLQVLEAHKQKVELTRMKMSNLLLEASTQDKSRQQEITVEFDPSTIQPQTEADVTFIQDEAEELRRLCKTFGDVYSEQATIDNCTASGEGLQFAVVEKQATVEVQNVGKLDLTAELHHERSGATIKCNVTQEGGYHTITYKPVNIGKHSLCITANGKHIQGSPFSVAVAPSAERLREPVRVIDGLNKPRGTAMNSKGCLIIAEYGSHFVSIVDQEGKRRTFGGHGSEHGKFDKPRGIAVDKDDNIYVSDCGNHRVQKFDCEGKFLAAVGHKGSENGEFNLPLGMCFNKKKDRLFVCDQLNYRVQVFTTNLSFKQTFGSEGSEEGQFNFPENIVIDDSNNLYVTDYYNNRVQVFSADGQYQKAISSKSSTGVSASPHRISTKDRLSHPRAVAVDSGGVVYMSEWESGGVSMFSSQGEFVGLLGSERVCGLTVDKNDHLIVSRKSKLEVFC